MDKKIPPPRGEPFKLLGLIPNFPDLEWISQNVGMDEFRQEIDKTIVSLPRKNLVRMWATALDEKERLGKEIRTQVYSQLWGRIPRHRYKELINDVHELDDTFLAILDSHVRHFLVLIPEVSAMVVEYDRLFSSFCSRNMALASILTDHFGWPPCTTDAREIIVAETLKRVRVEKGGTDE